MRKWTRTGRLTASVLGAVLLTACGDDTRSPMAPESARGSLTLGVGEVGTTVFSVGRAGGRFALAGGHVITFGDDAICDPLTSGYGPTTWNLPCQPVSGAITITATSWTDADGHARVDFSPDLRFVPTAEAPSRVRLQLRDRSAYDPMARVLYCPTIGECFDEAISDASLESKRDTKGVWVYRYVKHFSGYNVSTGRAMTADESIASLEVLP